MLECEKCGNTIGFTFGTCIEYGWNVLNKTFDHIEINVNLWPFTKIPTDIQDALIRQHEQRIKGRLAWRRDGA